MIKLVAVLVPIIATIVIVWVVYLSLYFTPKSDPEKPKRNPRVLLPDGGFLARPVDFYKDRQAATLTYLIGVYPQGARSLRALNYLQIAAFYNSLWFYYNCESSFDATFPSPWANGPMTKNCWQELPGCGKDFPKLPYTPQGYIYSVVDWIQSGTPFVYSNSQMPASYFALGVPGVPFWGSDTMGPAPLFMHQRAIFRNVYTNKLPLMQTWTNSKEVPETLSFTQPTIVPGLVGEFHPYWNYPQNWALGVPKNGWIEVLSADDPGMALSVTIMWLNGAIGSGVFYNVGNVLHGRNKVDATFLLATELAKSDAGKAALMDAYSTTDPYNVVASLLVNPVCAQKGGKVWDPVAEKTVECNWCSGGDTLGSIPSRYTPSIRWSENMYHFNVDDWLSFCSSSNPTVAGRSAGGIPNACIDGMRAGSNYLSDRIGSQGSFDEAMTWMGCWCGYDTIELIQSANGDGTSQVEILVLKNLPVETKNRDYSEFLQLPLIKDDTTGNLVATCQQGKFYVIPRQDKLDGFYAPYFKNFWAGLSLRDPLDINNDSKATTCQQPPWDKTRNGFSGDQYNLVCLNNSSKMLDRLNAYSKLSSDDYKEWNKCSPFGVGAGGKIMTTPDVWPSG